MRPLLYPALLCGVLASCATSPAPPLKTEVKVDLKSYGGKWYEIARFPKWFQRGCVSATARYSADPDGSIKVENTCIRKDDSRRSVTGVARPVDAAGNRLRVSFPEHWFGRLMKVPEEGNYWIIDASPDGGPYRQAIVGTPDRKSLWFLSRSPAISGKDFERMKATAREQGFDVSKLVIDGHTRVGNR